MGPEQSLLGIVLERSNSVKFSTLKIYFVLIKNTYYRALNAQKRENEAILGGYDVI